MKVVFFDLTCPKPYDPQTLATEAMGGSEASMIRWAEGLATRGHDVFVAQHNRSAPEVFRANYVSFETAEALSRPDVCIAYRTPELIPYIKERFPDTRLRLICSDFNMQDLVRAYPVLEDTGLKILGVSRTHKQLIADALLSQIPVVRGVTVDYVYNPLPDECVPDATPVNPHKLVYFSSPHKGLKRTLEVFKYLRRKDDRFTLTVANPGYHPDEKIQMKGVKNLGPLPHAEVLKQVRGALCTFHLNAVFPETFGMVHSESLAVGTPVLTARLGANSEIIRDDRMFIDVKDTDAVIARVMAWRDGDRPVCKGNDLFRLSNVINRLEGVLA